MSTNTTTPTPAPAQLLEPLITDPSTTTTTSSSTSPDGTGTAATADDAVQAAVQGFSDQLRAAAKPQTQTTQTGQGQTQTQTQQASIGDFVWRAYNALFDAAERTPPARQGPLLEFVARLRETVVTGEDGEVLRHEGGELWRELPTLGWEVRDRWNFDSSDPAATAKQRTEWENLNAFVAQLTARSSSDPDGPLDFSMFGLWVMRDAFEAENGVGSDTAVRLAALWVNFAGAYLRKLSVNGYEFSARIGIPNGKYAGREWKGFNEERWKAWGDELKVAQAKLASDETVQGAAKVMAEL
ncbi:predicted protein [Chaetomium globosum CBS 148.51]|uniref:Uncharacterized protein n=1 Tax=Chaetomium globosum (strain ATCC 6205 / CBS 148.51 / DSM 1962 / NBRC 6347 / NRRL 1970) TaxID=306901 RepID=Q2GM23_CHAGB|nr:uncharacterized protein CHGG_10981 [Chaetomium globosum CBS 148.51]EAQ83163.1 predicted protein [Chaetomium globosum CBS 148.51]